MPHVSCLGSAQDHGHVHEQRWLQKQIPLSHVGDLSANSQCEPDAWDLLYGKNTLDRELQKLNLSSQGWGGGCIAPRGQGDTFGLCSRGNAIVRLLGGSRGWLLLPQPLLAPSLPRQRAHLYFKTPFTAFTGEAGLSSAGGCFRCSFSPGTRV